MSETERSPAAPSGHAGGRSAAGNGVRAWLWRFSTLLLGLAVAAALALSMLVAVALAVAYPNLPEISGLTDYRPKLPLRVISADGVLLGEFGEERRIYTPIAEIPKVMQEAVLAIEDSRFYRHSGVDYIGVLRAALAQLSRAKSEGASTITMQVARNFYLSSEKTFTRKIYEVLLALKIHSVHPAKLSILIDLNEIFMHDFAQVGLGNFDANRSTWFKIKTFPKNVELQVSATFSPARGFFSFGPSEGVIDGRGNTVVLHYGLVQMPDDNYLPRLADDRVGTFLSVLKDYSTDNKDSSFLRYVNRWRLDRADTDVKNKDKLSVPKKKIVFWIEKTQGVGIRQ